MKYRYGDSIRDTAVDERRQETRFPKELGSDSAVVWERSGHEMLVCVHDESLHGICLVMSDVAAFKLGTMATIVYHSEVLYGAVRRITPQPDGTYLVGFECR
ncbi:MAG: hypothetical protein HY000_07060 [Planctomycetes bacterium]|nr:hypothetical protein [Planctomycetota bacterium]